MNVPALQQFLKTPLQLTAPAKQVVCILVLTQLAELPQEPAQVAFSSTYQPHEKKLIPSRDKSNKTANNTNVNDIL